jgi:hypothetical protein
MEIALPPVVIPVMIMGHLAASPFPVTFEEPLPIMMRHHPDGARIGGSGPIPFMPFVMVSHRIPIAFYPHVLGARA